MKDEIETEGTKVEECGEKAPDLVFAKYERGCVEKLERRDGMGVFEKCDTEGKQAPGACDGRYGFEIHRQGCS